jgi:hypothetical protein
MAPFPNSKIELHQWANSILLGIVGFFVMQTYFTIQKDHDKIAEHETKIAVHDEKLKQHQSSINFMGGSISEIRRLGNKTSVHELASQD